MTKDETLSLRIGKDVKARLAQIGNGTITRGIEKLVMDYNTTEAERNDVPEWYFHPETVDEAKFFRWARKLPDTEQNRGFLKQFWLMSAGKMSGYRGNPALLSFIEQSILDPESPFHIALVDETIKPNLQAWKSRFNPAVYHEMEAHYNELRKTIVKITEIYEWARPGWRIDPSYGDSARMEKYRELNRLFQEADKHVSAVK